MLFKNQENGRQNSSNTAYRLLKRPHMKTFSTLAKALSLILVCSAASFAASDPGTQTIQYDGSQADYSFSLKNDVTQTNYENREVPDTCYRDVPDGSERQCHTETNPVCGSPTVRRVCENTTRQECSQVNRQECGPVSQRECSIVYRNECHNESHRECTPTSRQECSTHQVCREVGHSQQCTPEQECHTVTDQDCRDVSQNVCENVPEQECRDVSHNECHNVTDNVCKNVPDTVCHDESTPNCHDESKNVCVDVPKTRHESYACTKTIQVPVGTTLISSDTASVSMHFDPTSFKAGDAAEQFVCTLDNGTVGLELGSTPVADTLLFEKLTQKSVSTDATHRQVTAAIGVRGVKLEDAVLPLTQDVADATLTATTLQFSVGKVTATDLLKLQVQLTADSDGTAVLAQQVLDLSKAKLSSTAAGRTLISLDLAQLGVAAGVIVPGQYQLQVTGTLVVADDSGLMNPDALANLPQLSKSVTLTIVDPNPAPSPSPSPTPTDDTPVVTDPDQTTTPTPTQTDAPVTLAEVAQMTAGGIQNLSLDRRSMSFSLSGPVREADFIQVHVTIQEDHMWGLWQTTQFDQDVTAEQFSVDNSSGNAQISIDFRANGLSLHLDGDSTYQVDVTVTPNADVLSKILAAEQLSQLKSTKAEQKFDL